MRKILAAATLLAIAVAASPAAAAEVPLKDRRELGYFLLKTRVAATVSQTLKTCSNGASELPEVLTVVHITDQSAPHQ